MTKKRFIKLLMGAGCSRNAANKQAKKVSFYGSYRNMRDCLFNWSPSPRILEFTFDSLGVSFEEAVEAFRKFSNLASTFDGTFNE